MKTPKPKNLDEELTKRNDDSFVAEVENLKEPEPLLEKGEGRFSFLKDRKNVLIIALLILFIWLGGVAIFVFAMRGDESEPVDPKPPVVEQPKEPEVPEDPEDPEEPPMTGSKLVERYRTEILAKYPEKEVVFAGMVTSEYRLESNTLGILPTIYTKGESEMDYIAQIELVLKGNDHLNQNTSIFSSTSHLVFDPDTGYIYFRTYNYEDEATPLGVSNCSEAFYAEERCPATLQKVHILDEDAEYEAVLEDQDPFDLMYVRTTEGIKLVAYREILSRPGDWSTRKLSLHRIDLEEGIDEDAMWEFQVTSEVQGLDPSPSFATNDEGLISFAYVKGKAPTYLGYVTIENVDVNTGVINVRSMSLQEEVFTQALQVSPNGRHVAIIGSGDGPNSITGPFIIVDVVDKKAMSEELTIDNVSLAWTGDKYQFVFVNSIPGMIYDPISIGYSEQGQIHRDSIFRLGPSYPSYWVMYTTGDSNNNDGEIRIITPDNTITNKLPEEFNNESRLSVFDWYMLGSPNQVEETE